MLAYRAFFTVPAAGDLHATVAHHLHAWLRADALAADRLGDGAPRRLGDGVEGSSLAHAGPDGGHTVRTRIVDERDGWQRTVELTVHAPASPLGTSGWVLLDVHAPQDSPPVEPPPLVEALLGALDAHDGDVPLSREPYVLVGPAQVDALLDALTAPGRRGLVLVAGCDETAEPDAWHDRIRPLLRDPHGLAAGYVLDPRATALLAATAGAEHAVAGGTLRAFQPGVFLGDRADGLRHQTLAIPAGGLDGDESLAASLGRRAAEVALRAPLPAAVRDVDRTMRTAWAERLLAQARPPRRAVLDQVVDAPPAPTTDRRDPHERRTRRALDALLTDLTGQARLTGDAVATLAALVAERRAEPEASLARDAALDQLGARIADLEARLEHEAAARAAAVRAHEDEQVERALAEEARADAQRHLRHLQLRCARDEDADGSVWTAPEPDALEVAPASLGELLARLRARELPHVVFTGAEDVTASLDEHDLAGTAARKAWEAMLALDDYASQSLAGRCPTDVTGYLRATPPGCRGFSAARHARGESDDVRGNRRFASARTLPVPTEVDPSGRVGMWAHFKLTQSGMTSPRLHYHDASATTGHVYVGYIGPHLPNGQTN